LENLAYARLTKGTGAHEFEDGSAAIMLAEMLAKVIKLGTETYTGLSVASAPVVGALGPRVDIDFPIPTTSSSGEVSAQYFPPGMGNARLVTAA
jgi:hypothetical protein